jgi:hypothetical protein
VVRHSGPFRSQTPRLVTTVLLFITVSFQILCSVFLAHAKTKDHFITCTIQVISEAAVSDGSRVGRWP